MPSVFSSDQIAPRHRLDAWRSFVSDAFVPTDIVGAEQAGFEARMEAVSLGEVGLARFTGSRQGFNRTRPMIRSSQPDGFVASIPLSGRLRFTHGAESGETPTGGITLFEMAGETCTTNTEDMNVLAIALPRFRVEALFGSVRNLGGLTLGAEAAMTPIIIGFLRSVMASAESLTGDSAARLGTIAADLLAAGFLERMGRDPNRSMGIAACAARAKAFIRANLGDSLLSPEMVARRQGFSLRRLQEIFAAERLTVSNYIWEQRLLRARDMLSSRAFDRLTLDEVARAAGFSGSPHFFRRVRARFGQTPREIRDLTRLVQATA